MLGLRRGIRRFVQLAAVLLILAGSASPVGAASYVEYEACVLARKPTSALMMLIGDGSKFELDLRPVPDTPFALKVDECVQVSGVDHDNEPGQRREFPEGQWLVEAQTISAVKSHLNRSNHSSNNDED